MLEKVSDWLHSLMPLQIIDVHFSDTFNLEVSISIPVLITIILLVISVRYLFLKQTSLDLVEVEISLGHIGKAKLKPNYNDIQIAHKIWVELITRKAAIEIDPEHDVIVEVYNSWYALFQCIRQLIAEIPAEQVRNQESTQTIVRIATQSLNEGLRPHLTKWQAKFRNWYEHQKEELKNASPQEVQKRFPEFKELNIDLLSVNRDLIAYAKELKKICDG